jgi:hypothetical protein
MGPGIWEWKEEKKFFHDQGEHQEKEKESKVQKVIRQAHPA